MSAEQFRVVWSHGFTLFLVLLLAQGTSAYASTQPDSPPDLPRPLPLSWCIERASAANPSLEAVDAEAAAARESADAAGRLDDPRFGYEMLNLPTEDWNLHSAPMSGRQLSLKRGARMVGFASRPHQQPVHFTTTQRL